MDNHWDHLDLILWAGGRCHNCADGLFKFDSEYEQVAGGGVMNSIDLNALFGAKPNLTSVINHRGSAALMRFQRRRDVTSLVMGVPSF